MFVSGMQSRINHSASQSGDWDIMKLGLEKMANLSLQPVSNSSMNDGSPRNTFKSSLVDHFVSSSSSSIFSHQYSTNGNSSQVSNQSLFNQQRSSFDKRPIQPVRPVNQDWSANAMGSIMIAHNRSSSSYDSHNAISDPHNVLDNANFNILLDGSENLPSLLDWSEFPSLTSRNEKASLQSFKASMSAKQPYVGMLKAPTSESSEFTMSNEDFPALPGTEPTTSGNSSVSSTVSRSRNTSLPNNNQKFVNYDSNSHLIVSSQSSTGDVNHKRQQNDSQPNQKAIQSLAKNKVSNIPSTMVKDQFGMIGLLTFIRAAESVPNLVSLALGQDLTTLGLNLNSAGNLYTTFDGPWSDSPCRLQDLDYDVPPEYIVNHGIRDKLAQIKLTRYKEDLLFHLFYNYSGDVIQFVAALELYNREWRYHTEEIVWITPAPGLGISEKTPTYERGTFYFFDTTSWRKVAKEFHLEYSKLENRPTVPLLGYSYV